ncbi:MAG: nuclear transport factor 2 family protein [Deltaproteobacteria bacterium]|nr:nuclear transport factor 2 family protein [Deltaproteobacteria bacterium]
MRNTVIIISILIACMFTLFGCGGSPGDSAKIKEITEQMEVMRKQLDDVQAVAEIERLQTQYLDYVIYNKLDDVWTLFSEDGVLDVFQEKEPAKGAEEITAIFQERKAMVEENSKQGRHAIMFDGSPIITVDGDTAKSRFLLFNIMSMDSQGLGVQQGYYEMEFVKEKGEWKISLLKYTREFSIGAGNPSPGMGQGGAGRDGSRGPVSSAGPVEANQ